MAGQTHQCAPTYGPGPVFDGRNRFIRPGFLSLQPRALERSSNEYDANVHLFGAGLTIIRLSFVDLGADTESDIFVRFYLTCLIERSCAKWSVLAWVWRNTCLGLSSERRRCRNKAVTNRKAIIMRSTVTPKTIRRLLAADGYLHLELPHQAIIELEKIREAGVLEGPRRLLMGISLKRCGDFAAATEHLEIAARTMPGPVRNFAWSELAECYRDSGSDELADLAESLGGEKTYELRIGLPFGEISVESTNATHEIA